MSESAPPPYGSPGRHRGRILRGFGATVATPHVLSTQAAMTVLARGGNAADAAIAACAVQGVVAPQTCGVGGDLFALVHRPGETEPAVLNASGRAGSGVDAAALRTTGHATVPRSHPAAIPVPGCVDGWTALSSGFGRVGLDETLRPAIELAESGFPADDDLVRSVDALADVLSGQAAAAPMLAVGPGDRVRRAELATTLRGVAAGGRDAFYDGAPGAAISAATEGIITPDDLRRSQADWVQPLGVPAWGATAWTVPPNSQGYLAVAACAVLARLTPAIDLDDPATWHLAIEAYRAVAADRDLVADPASMTRSATALVSPDRLDAIAAGVDVERARPRHAQVPAVGGTAYLCVADDTGLGVSLIQSNFNGFGSGVGAGTAGFLLHDRGRGFTLQAGHANELAPGHRPFHTLSPTLWTRDGRLSMLLGTRGGQFQPQIVLQVAAAIAGGGADVDAGQDCPRWTLEPAAGSQPATGSRPRIEPGTPAGVVEGLRARGHDVAVEASPRPGWGPVSVIVVGDDGLRETAADPRVATTAVAAT